MLLAWLSMGQPATYAQVGAVNAHPGPFQNAHRERSATIRADRQRRGRVPEHQAELPAHVSATGDQPHELGNPSYYVQHAPEEEQTVSPG